MRSSIARCDRSWHERLQEVAGVAEGPCACTENAHEAANKIRGGQYSTFRSQIIRAALSIPANIVEGREQQSEAGFGRFLRIALGSTSELEYHLLAARDIRAIS